MIPFQSTKRMFYGAQAWLEQHKRDQNIFQQNLPGTDCPPPTGSVGLSSFPTPHAQHSSQAFSSVPLWASANVQWWAWHWLVLIIHVLCLLSWGRVLPRTWKRSPLLTTSAPVFCRNLDGACECADTGFPMLPTLSRRVGGDEEAGEGGREGGRTGRPSMPLTLPLSSYTKGFWARGAFCGQRVLLTNIAEKLWWAHQTCCLPVAVFSRAHV